MLFTHLLKVILPQQQPELSHDGHFEKGEGFFSRNWGGKKETFDFSLLLKVHFSPVRVLWWIFKTHFNHQSKQKVYLFS